MLYRPSPRRNREKTVRLRPTTPPDEQPGIYFTHLKHEGYKIRNQAEVHFLTFAVVEWVDVFTRPEYRDLVVDSLIFCQKNKGLRIHGWCLMTNHLHLLVSSASGDLSGTLRDFKKFTATRLLTSIACHQQESRRDWMLPIFRKAGSLNSRNLHQQFWRQENQPKECFSASFTIQKLQYIHENPVQAGLVDHSWEYRFSSARDYHFSKPCGLVQIDFL